MITPRLAWPKTTITSTFALLFSFTYFWNSNITSNFDQLSSFFLPSFTIYHRSYRGRAKNPIEIIIQIVSHNSLFCRLDLYFKSCFIWSNFFTNLLANIFATFTFAKFTFHKTKQKLFFTDLIVHFVWYIFIDGTTHVWTCWELRQHRSVMRIFEQFIATDKFSLFSPFYLAHSLLQHSTINFMHLMSTSFLACYIFIIKPVMTDFCFQNFCLY